MYTRCPTCQTHFRVSREQLQASSGQVRCGRCQAVFDAFATLSAQPPAAARTRGASVQPEPGTSTAGAQLPGAAAPPTAGAWGNTAETLPEERFGVPSSGSQPHDEILTLPDDLFGSGMPVPESGRKWPWVLGSVMFLVLLGVQTLFFFGSDLAGSWPGLRPVLAQGCDWLGCRIALARVPDQLFIEASDMQVLNPANASQVLLTATLRNRAAVPQELPLLEVTLTDAMNQTASRKVFYPAEYLDKTTEQPVSVGPNQEIMVKLYLDTADIKPTGYRLYLFFA
jgi:predicted Zn finger-like uncharacterized protein